MNNPFKPLFNVIAQFASDLKYAEMNEFQIENLLASEEPIPERDFISIINIATHQKLISGSEITSIFVANADNKDDYRRTVLQSVQAKLISGQSMAEMLSLNCVR